MDNSNEEDNLEIEDLTEHEFRSEYDQTYNDLLQWVHDAPPEEVLRFVQKGDYSTVFWFIDEFQLRVAQRIPFNQIPKVLGHFDCDAKSFLQDKLSKGVPD